MITHRYIFAGGQHGFAMQDFVVKMTVAAEWEVVNIYFFEPLYSVVMFFVLKKIADMFGAVTAAFQFDQAVWVDNGLGLDFCQNYRDGIVF
jgi:hypothetical protein